MMNSPFTRPTRTAPIGPWKRNVGDGQRGRSAVDGRHVRIIFGIRRKHQRDDLSLVAETFGEQRADGTIDLPAGQDLALAGPAFALDEAAGNAAAGVSVFAVVNREREKIDALARLGVGNGGGQNDVFAHANNGGAVRLLGQFAGLERQFLAAVQLNRDGLRLWNFMSSFRLERTSQPEKSQGRNSYSLDASLRTRVAIREPLAGPAPDLCADGFVVPGKQATCGCRVSE